MASAPYQSNRVTKTRRWLAGHVPGIESECIKEKVKKRNRLENLDGDGKNYVKWTLERGNGSVRTGFARLRIRPITCPGEHNHELSRLHKTQCILDQLNDCKTLKKRFKKSCNSVLTY